MKVNYRLWLIILSGEKSMLFPYFGSQFLSDVGKSTISRMEAAYAEAITINQSFWAEADTDWRFMVGDQTLWNDLYGNLPANRRRQFNFNRIRRIVNMISGHQRRNRKSTTVIPIENADSMTADQFTKILIWLENQENYLETISEAFEGALVGGMNFLQVWMDYRSDPVSGNIRVDNCSYNSFLVDPYFRKTDLSDCNFMWKRSFLTKRECVSLMPDRADEIISLPGNDSGTGRDGKFQFMPESYNYGIKNLLTYDEFYYRDYRTQKLLIDVKSGETFEWKMDNDDLLREFLQQYPQITVSNQEIQTCNVAIVIQGKVFYDGPNPMGIDKYPFVPVFAYYNPQMPYFPWRIQGIVRNLRDPQYLYNRRKIIELDMLESQITAGWKYKENALVNPKDVFLTGQGRGLALKEEASMDDVQQIIPPAVPPTTIELSKILGSELSEISGVNEELLGSAMDDKAGILSMLRQGAGLTTLQGLFDQLDRSQKLLGKLCIDLIQANFTPGKVKKIIHDEPAPQFYNKAFGKYDAAIEDGLNTSTQRQMNFAQMIELRKAGIPIPDTELLEASTLQNKNRLIQAMVQQQQGAQQAQQMQTQAALQEQAARTQLAHARAQADAGLGVERLSRVEENRALAIERQAAAEKDRDIGLLNLIKAMKEIDSVDIEQIEKLIALSRTLQPTPEASPGQLVQPGS